MQRVYALAQLRTEKRVRLSNLEGRNAMSLFLLLVSTLIAIGRFTVPGHGPSWPGTYEAFAHIWVGALLVLAIQRSSNRWNAILCLVAITVLEVVMFILR